MMSVFGNLTIGMFLVQVYVMNGTCESEDRRTSDIYNYYHYNYYYYYFYQCSQTSFPPWAPLQSNKLMVDSKIIQQNIFLS